MPEHTGTGLEDALQICKLLADDVYMLWVERERDTHTTHTRTRMHIGCFTPFPLCLCVCALHCVCVCLHLHLHLHVCASASKCAYASACVSVCEVTCILLDAAAGWTADVLYAHCHTVVLQPICLPTVSMPYSVTHGMGMLQGHYSAWQTS